MKGLKGMTSCLDVLLDIKPIVGDCSRHRLEKAWLERWTSVSYARQVWSGMQKGCLHNDTHVYVMPPHAER